MDQRVSCKNILISLQKQFQNNTHAIVIIYKYITVRLFLHPKRPLSTPGRFVVSGRRNIGNDRSDHCRDRQRATTELLARRHSGAVARARFGTGGHERRRRAGHGPGRFSGTLRPNRRTACGYGNASARHDGRRSSDRAGAKIHRTALRLLVPTGQRQDVLQRTGMGKLPCPGRQQTISGPADEFPRGRRIVTPGSGQNCLPDWERRFPRIFPERIPTTWHAIRNSKRSPAAIDMAFLKRAAR